MVVNGKKKGGGWRMEGSTCLTFAEPFVNLYRDSKPLIMKSNLIT